jgi:uncharacterized protein YdaU (DUF1376 family)
MHYYKRNLGDYAKKAGRLSMLQHGSYTLLIDACYDREEFPTLDEAIEWTWASTTEEIEAVKFVLNRFFTLTADGKYVQDRILQELLEYHAKADKNKTIAIERETKRKEKSTKRAEDSTKRAQDVNEAPPNHKPLTNNHKPLTIIKTISRTSALDDGFDEFWNAYPKKVGKDKAVIAWKKKKPKVDHVLNALRWQKESEQWTKNSGQFIPNPTTYINEGRWQDEPTAEGIPF